MGSLPPIVLATLRDKMVGLSAEIADGAVWANASRSRMAHSISLIPETKAARARNHDALTTAMSNDWLDDSTLSGSADRVREGVESWFDAGVTNPILVPSSTAGGQMKALEEIFGLYR